MPWFINLFIDVANIINAWVPLICYLGAPVCFLLACHYARQAGNPAHAAGGDSIKAVLYFCTSFLLVGIIRVINAGEATFGLAADVGLGGGQLPYLAQVPQIQGNTPQQIFQGWELVFDTFFKAWGAKSILHAVFLIKNAHRDGIDTAGPVAAYFVAGVILANLNTIIQLALTDWAGA